MAQTVTKIGKYDVIEVLGKGGMGVVYKAMDNLIERVVAIKMMTGGFAENPDLLKRFYREAKSTGMLQHPNIVIVYDLGDHEGNPYLVMEYLDGEPLDKIIAAHREISVVEKLGYIIQACNGLGYAHQRGIVHRDVKPANLMVLRDGTCKIVDFGIARIGDNSMTRTGQVVGTITYMSPEQINAQVVDGRTDIFSCGCMLYELLTGVVPFEGKDTASTLLKIIHEPPPPLSNYLKNYPAELDAIIGRALAKDREERYATAEDFAFDLARAQEQLKKQLVSDYVARAKSSIEKADLLKAKEILQVVLKVDTQHHVAKELMQEVQQRMQRQVRGEQIKQLRANAEEAFQQRSFQDALAYAEQALTLDKSNTELVNLRDMIAAAKAKKEKLDTALRRAEAAQQNGDLDAAAKAAEEALGLDPESTQVKALHASIAKELADRRKHQQLQSMLDEARRDISSRKFTAAFDVLKKAEQIDQASPEIAALMKLATSGREEEHRRKEVERFTAEIEDALAKENFKGACELIEEALGKFPTDAGLQKLKTLADRQREAGEKKKFVEEQISAARKLLDAGKSAEAQAILEGALRKVPGDARLRSMLGLARESAEQEKAEKLKGDYIQKANEARRKRDYDSAIKILETANAQIEGSTELQEMLQLIRDEATSAKQRKRVEAAADEAQRLLSEEEYEAAVTVLENALRQAPNEELKLVLADAKQRVEDFNRKVSLAVTKAQRMLETRKFEDAATFLEAQPKSFVRKSEFTAVLEKARSEQDTVKSVKATIEKATEAISKGDFGSGQKILEACKKSYGETPEVKQAFAEFESKRVAAAKTKLDKAIKDARMLLLARQYAAAMRELENVAPLVSAATPDLQKQFETLKNDASAGVARIQKEVDLGKTIVAGSQEMSQTMVAGSVEAAAAGVGAARAPAARASAAAAPYRPAPAPVVVKKSPAMTITVVVLALIVVAGIGYFMLNRPSGPGGAVGGATTYLEINAVPYGTVKSVTGKDGKTVDLKDNQTPLRIAVAPGEYTIVVTGPKGQEDTQKKSATNDSPGSDTAVFEQVDIDKILQSQ